MKFLVQNHSGYPPNDSGSVALDEVIGDQESSGADIVTDGLINWSDPLAAALYSAGGVETGLAMAYGSYPVLLPSARITGTLHHNDPFAMRDFVHAHRVAKRPVKALLAGPYSLARLIQSQQPTASLVTLAEAWSTVITTEVEELAKAGTPLIQVHEPLLAEHPEDIRLARRILEPLWAARGKADMAIALPYANAQPMYAELNSLPTDMLVLDVASSPGLLELIEATGTSKTLVLGIADPHAAEVETVDKLCRRIEPLLRRYGLDELHLSPAAGLMFVRRQRANETLQRLRLAADDLNGRTQS